MTVFTNVKESRPPKKVLQSAVCIDTAVYANNSAPLYSKLCRHKIFASCCVALLLLWLLVASFLAGVFLYRQLYRRAPYYGWCSTKYVQHGKTERVVQGVEINPDEQYEKIDVNRIGSNRPAIFLHDFRKNVTAIVDVLTNRCFLKELDRSVVAPPSNLIDLVEKIQSGYYERSPSVVRETYRVAARLSEADLRKLRSYMISRHCSHRVLFLLEKASRIADPAYFVRDKRDVSEPRIQFSVMSGNAVEVDQIIL